MNRHSKSAIIARNRRIMLLIAIICSILFAFIFSTTRVAAENSKPVNKYYTSYEIQPGDTLWTIADQFMNAEYSDKTAFIDEIKSINHISGDNITAGSYIVVEYYAYDEP